jgi:predicted Fe-S protein YdhL (DUF1289 family)
MVLSDTSAEIEALVTARHRAMTPSERCQIASTMYDGARAIVESSLPAHLTGRERRRAYAQRMYGTELPPAALDAFAAYAATSHEPTAPIPSPCVGICCIGADGLCFGCYRNRAELSAWRTASESEKREILVQCQLRQVNLK